MSDKQLARYGFVKIVVRDLDRQTDFYRAVIGYGEGQLIRGKIAGRDIEEIILSAEGKPELIILKYLDTDPALNATGVINIYFTSDLEAFERRVLAAGGSVAQPIGPLSAPGSKARLAFYADPEGFLLEVIES